ncbi:MAG: NAD(P)H-binding protein [Pseudomonadota bacterium]
MSTTLVVGANGTVGSILVQALLAKGQQVVSATSRPAEGPSQVHLNLLTGEGIEQAFDGVDQAFLMAPPGHTNQHELLNPLIDMARERNLRKVVLMSAIGVDADDTIPLRQAELHLARSGLRYNVIRPNWFMQNFNSYWIEGILKAGTVSLPVGDARTSFIDARDIAACAAALLTTDTFDNQIFVLTGAQALTHAEAAGILSTVTGKTISFRDITPEENLDQLIGAGLPRPYAEFMNVILGLLKLGYVAPVSDAVAQLTGRAPIGFEQYARDYRQAWAR